MMLPKTLALTIQLSLLMLLVCCVLMLVRVAFDGWAEVGVFAIAAAAIVWLWQKLRLHDYFFG